MAVRLRIVAALLLVFALWPIGHRWLVVKFDVNPWRCFGWAMYCVPVFQPRMELWTLDPNGERVEVPYPASEPIHDLVRGRYLLERANLGRLATPDEISLLTFLEYDRLETLIVRLEWTVFDTGTQGLAGRAQEYQFTLPRSVGDLRNP